MRFFLPRLDDIWVGLLVLLSETYLGRHTFKFFIMGVSLFLTGIKEAQSSVFAYDHVELFTEPLDYLLSRHFLEQHLACVSVALKLNYKGLYDLFDLQLENSLSDIRDYETMADYRARLEEIGQESKSQQELVDQLEAKWGKLQNNIGAVKVLVHEFREAFKDEKEVARQLSDTPISIVGSYEDLSPRQSFQKVLDLYGPEAFDELCGTLDLLQEKGVVTVWLEEI
jgi:hypothetical protein